MRRRIVYDFEQFILDKTGIISNRELHPVKNNISAHQHIKYYLRKSLIP